MASSYREVSFGLIPTKNEGEKIKTYEKKERGITTADWFALGRVGPVTVGLVHSSEYCVSKAGDPVGT